MVSATEMPNCEYSLVAAATDTALGGSTESCNSACQLVSMLQHAQNYCLYLRRLEFDCVAQERGLKQLTAC